LPKGLSAYAQWLCLHLFERLSFLTEAQKDSIQRAILHAKEPFKALNLQREEVLQRYEQIDAILAKTVLKQPQSGYYSRLTRLLDRWLLHPLAGYATFLLVLLLIFQSVFTWASVPMDWIDASFSEFVNWVHLRGGDSLWVSFVADGLLAGLGGILVFVPQIAILFFLLGILEETGYMARVAVLMDKVMRQFGLNGRSVVPLVSGVACAIPAIMAARTIPNPKERLITMMVVPLMSCSARLPVYTVLVALAVPNTLLWGWLSLQGVVMLGLYLLGTLMSLLVAWLLNRFLRMEQGRSFFMLEMPLYRLPRWRNLLLTVWEKARTFVVEAGKVILLISVLIWGLASFGPGNAMEEAERELRRQLQGKATDEQIENAVASVRLEQSYAGYLGRFIEPAIRPLGYDWKIGIALISSFAAREVFVGTISTIYSIGSEDEMTVVERLRSEINPHTGKPVFNLATSVSLLLFYAFAMQCMSDVSRNARLEVSFVAAALHVGDCLPECLGCLPMVELIDTYWCLYSFFALLSPTQYTTTCAEKLCYGVVAGCCLSVCCSLAWNCFVGMALSIRLPSYRLLACKRYFGKYACHVRWRLLVVERCFR
jgi:ferrous iron transport protein B